MNQTKFQKKLKKQQKQNQNLATTRLENKLLSCGFSRVVGIDEVGRGAWAGPVTVCGFLYTSKTNVVSGVTDSKLLKINKRQDIFAKVSESEYYLAYASPQEIDFEGVGKAIEKLIQKIINHFDDGSTYFLIDGVFKNNFHTSSEKIISGDMLHYSISMASIIAKVSRDTLMKDLSQIYPKYGFDTNVGYPSKKHRESIDEHGVLEIHRKSYKPIMQRLLRDE